MKGEAVPLVLIPRYTSYIGANTFTTVPLDVLSYEAANVTFWRGPLRGSSGGTPFLAEFQVSHDSVVWKPLYTSDEPITDPDTITYYEFSLDKRYFRGKVVLEGNDRAITCWATGQLVRRLKGGT